MFSVAANGRRCAHHARIRRDSHDCLWQLAATGNQRGPRTCNGRPAAQRHQPIPRLALLTCKACARHTPELCRRAR
eukprot:362969-Chlamydomonas_euryale.AAC.2